MKAIDTTEFQIDPDEPLEVTCQALQDAFQPIIKRIVPWTLTEESVGWTAKNPMMSELPVADPRSDPCDAGLWTKQFYEGIFNMAFLRWVQTNQHRKILAFAREFENQMLSYAHDISQDDNLQEGEIAACTNVSNICKGWIKLLSHRVGEAQAKNSHVEYSLLRFARHVRFRSDV